MRHHPLELRIPPPLVALALALLMAGTAWAMPALGWRAPPQGAAGHAAHLLLSLLPTALGLTLDLSGWAAFRRARTTVHPLHPDRSRTLVTRGLYRVSRNPMYLGMLLMLAGWALWLAHPLAAAGPIAFVAWINRFQIGPEERALSQAFGPAYDDYRARVRRWL